VVYQALAKRGRWSLPHHQNLRKAFLGWVFDE
jgi:hypothetical protein